jgi:hypothetical protein
MKPTDDPFHPDNLRIDPKTLLKAEPVIRRTWDRSKNDWVLPEDLSAALHNMGFVLLPTEPLAKMAAAKRSPELAVLIRLWQRWFVQYRKNPVSLARTEIKGFQVSRKQKYKALKNLAEWGFILVKSRPGKAPIITLLWRPQKP